MEQEPLERISSINSTTLHQYLRQFEIEYDIESEIEELQAIFYSIIEYQYTWKSFDILMELSLGLYESYPFLSSFIESNENKLTIMILDQLESFKQKNLIMLPIIVKEKIEIPISITKIGVIPILLDDNEGNTMIENKIWIRCDKIKRFRILSDGLSFGYHNLQIFSQNQNDNLGSLTQSLIFSSSPLYTFCLSLDSCIDHVYWCWEGNWTTELETSILELLISVNDELVMVIQNMKAMFQGIMSAGVNDLEEMLQIIQEDLRLVLTTHSNYSLGRLHQTFLQFLEMNEGVASSMMRIPQQFIRSIEIFLLQKVSACPLRPLLNQIRRLYFAVISYQDSLVVHPYATKDPTEISRLTSFIQIFSSRFSTPTNHAITSSDDPLNSYLDVLNLNAQNLWPNNEHFSLDDPSLPPPLTYQEIIAIHNLKPNEIQTFYSGSSILPQPPSQNPLVYLTRSITYHPVLSVDTILNTPLLQQQIDFHSESLLMDCIFIQSILGYSIKGYDNSVSLTCQLIQQLLDNGLTYVISQSSKLIILFPIQRAMIFLIPPLSFFQKETTSSEQPVQVIFDNHFTHYFNSYQSYLTGSTLIPKSLSKRLKDMPRIFRNKLKKNLSFRINSAVDYSIEMLRTHHGDNCWITADLIEIWKELIKRKQFYVFELWYDTKTESGEQGILLAADFCHLSHSGCGIYVATRYHNSSAEYRSFQSGFILALLSCQYLQKKGFLLWDLGGVDECPLMRYKYDLSAKPHHRAESVFLLKEMREYYEHNKDELAKSDGGVISSGIVIDEVILDDLWGK